VIGGTGKIIVRSDGPPLVRPGENWMPAEVRMADSITALMKIGPQRGSVIW